MKTNRIPFTLKDYQSGKYKVVTRDGNSVRIVCTDFNNGRQSIVALISLRNGEESCTSFNTDGKYWNNGETYDYDLFLKETVFEDGDVVFFGYGAIGIFKMIGESIHSDHVTLTAGVLCYMPNGWINNDMRLATEEEKEKLFDALRTEGKRWNAEKKCIEDIKKEYQFKPFDRVLVRDDDEEEWGINLFSHYASVDSYRFVCSGNEGFNQCIPYEGNEELLGTTNSPKQ